MGTKQQFAINSKSLLYEMLYDFFREIAVDEAEEVLTRNLIAGIGFDKHIATQTSSEISTQVFNMGVIKRFLRRIPVELAGVAINEDKALKEIQAAFDTFDYDEAELMFNYDLAYFISQSGDEINDTSIACINNSSAIYRQALKLIELCLKYYQAILNNEETKSPAQ